MSECQMNELVSAACQLARKRACLWFHDRHISSPLFIADVAPGVDIGGGEVGGWNDT